jgi:hypothetical protein
MHERLKDSFLDLHGASLDQNLIVVFDEHYQVAVVSSEEFSYKFRERQLIFPRNGRLANNFHGIRPAWKHGIHGHRQSVTAIRTVW